MGRGKRTRKRPAHKWRSAAPTRKVEAIVPALLNARKEGRLSPFTSPASDHVGA
jgi:hypothetical protein